MNTPPLNQKPSQRSGEVTDLLRETGITNFQELQDACNVTLTPTEHLKEWFGGFNDTFSPKKPK